MPKGGCHEVDALDAESTNGGALGLFGGDLHAIGGNVVEEFFAGGQDGFWDQDGGLDVGGAAVAVYNGVGDGVGPGLAAGRVVAEGAVVQDRDGAEFRDRDSRDP